MHKKEETPSVAPPPVLPAEEVKENKPNWTPDIVAAMLGIFLGLILGPILALSTVFLGPGLMILSVVPIFVITMMLAYLYKHMDLQGYRHYQQSYFFLSPLVVTYITVSLALYALMQKIRAALMNIQPMVAASGAELDQAVRLPMSSAQEILFFGLAMSIIVLVPFAVMDRRDFRFWWILPVIVPLSAALFTYYLIGFAGVF
jgi:hypothetical protein